MEQAFAGPERAFDALEAALAFLAHADAASLPVATLADGLRALGRAEAALTAARMAWMRRLAVHPQVAAALADSAISASLARHICDLSDRLPADVRADADAILLAAALGARTWLTSPDWPRRCCPHVPCWS